MTQILAYVQAFGIDRRAVTALEYGLIAAAVVAIGLAGFSVVGTDLSTIFGNVQNALGS